MTSAAMPAGNPALARRRVPGAWISSRPQMTGEQLPVDVDLSPSRLGALILCLAGLFVLWSAQEFLHQIFEAEELLLVVIASLFPLIGVGLIVAGLVQLYRRQHVTFGESGVEVSERNLTGARRWSAAYSEYMGVLQREHVVRRKNRSTTYQIIQLVHPEPSFDLPLHITRGDRFPRERWEELARRLRLPALQLDDDRITARPAETLDDSLAEQLRAGHASAGHGYGPAPEAVTVGEDADGLLIVFKRGRLPSAGYALFALIPLAFIGVGAVDPEGWPHMVLGAVFLVVIGWLGWKDSTSPRAIRLTREAIENLDEWRWNAGDAESVSLDDIEGVRIYRNGKLASRAVAVESDHGTMHLGQGLSRADLTWLRDFLIARIAQQVRRNF